MKPTKADPDQPQPRGFTALAWASNPYKWEEVTLRRAAEERERITRLLHGDDARHADREP
jgi:hypothetical protein